MHPSGFDTRAVASEEAAIFLAIAQGTFAGSVDERIREILDANSFLQKIGFIKDVLKGWIRHGRLGGRPSQHEIYWEGAQERPQPGGPGGKFVWVTVGSPGGDGEYRAISLKPGESLQGGEEGNDA